MPGDQSPILVPLDGSKNAENAIPMAVFLANAYAAPLHFVNVADPGEVRGELDLEKAAEYFTNYARDLMARETVDAGYQASLLTGKAADAILDAAAGSAPAPAARAVVIATHGIGGMKATLIGSVADKVIRGATVPTLVVPGIGPAAQPSDRPVVVGLDGSERAEQGLAAARELAAKLGARVVLVRACQVPPSAGYQFTYYYPPIIIEELEQAARTYLDQVALPGEVTLVTRGAAVASLVGAANHQDASAVVVTSQGRGFVSRVLIGSTTSTLTHNLQRPLLVVPAAG